MQKNRNLTHLKKLSYYSKNLTFSNEINKIMNGLYCAMLNIYNQYVTSQNKKNLDSCISG